MKKALVLLSVLFMFTASIVVGQEGKISGGLPDSYQLASIADWYTCKQLDISGEAGNIVIKTKYSGLVCKAFLNRSGSTVAVKVITTIGDTVHIPIAAYAQTSKQPPIKTIFKTGTSDSLTLYFQKR